MKFNNVLAQIDKNEFIEFYRFHNNKDTAKYFSISSDMVTKVSRHYNFVKSAEDIRETQRRTSLEHYGVDNPSKSEDVKNKIRCNRDVATMKKRVPKKLIEAKERISRDELYEKYIKNDITYEEIAKMYSISEYTLDKLINEYGLHKSRKQSASNVNKTKLKLYPIDNLNNWKKGHLTRIKNSGSLEKSYADGIVKAQNTSLERYGYKCFVNSPLIKSVRNKKDSAPNKHFANLLTASGIEFEQEFIIDTRAYDFKVGNTLIEINPTITHNIEKSPYSGVGLDKNYHKNKTELANSNGYNCIHIWDWDDANKIIELLKPRQRIYARHCSVEIVDKSVAKNFINKYHLQGYAKDFIRLGIYYNNELVSIMTFDKPRYNKNYEWELVRYCSSMNVVGGADKLFTHFIKMYNPNSIISYCDRSKFSGNTYTKLGFNLKSNAVSKHWYCAKTKSHYTDNLVRQHGVDRLLGTSYGKGTSNTDILLNNGYLPVVDVGQASFIWLK